MQLETTVQDDKLICPPLTIMPSSEELATLGEELVIVTPGEEFLWATSNKSELPEVVQISKFLFSS